MNPTQGYPTAHQLARELLKLPDLPVVLPVRVFDSTPDHFEAYPVEARESDVEGIPVVVVGVAKIHAPISNLPDTFNYVSPHSSVEIFREVNKRLEGQEPPTEG